MRKRKEYNETDSEELQEMGVKIDFLHKDFFVGGQFFMSGVRWLHVGNKKCIIVRMEDELNTIPNC